MDILEAIEKIDRHQDRGKIEFASDELFQVWVVRHLQIIGEAASRFSMETQTLFPDIPWGKMIGMRHILVHGYFEIDLEIVWSVVENDLLDLKNQITNCINTLA